MTRVVCHQGYGIRLALITVSVAANEPVCRLLIILLDAFPGTLPCRRKYQNIYCGDYFHFLLGFRGFRDR